MKVKCTTCNGTKELEVNYEDSTEYGDFFTLKEFIDMCECGGFIDYDGHGNYATAEQCTNINISPSHVMKKIHLTEFTHVMWYNR